MHQLAGSCAWYSEYRGFRDEKNEESVENTCENSSHACNHRRSIHYEHIAQYSFPIVTKPDLQSLKSSQLRTDANRTFHLDIIDDEEKINRIWKVLKSTIDDIRTCERHERL